LAAAAVLLTPTTLLAEAVVEENSVTFKYDATRLAAPPTDVNLAGSFNGWNAGVTDMTDPDGDGIWTATLDLPDGTHHYKFVVDGNWITDPTDDADLRIGDNFGGQNSGVIVGPDIRKAPPVEDGTINAEYVRHDPVKDSVQLDNRAVRVRIYLLPGDASGVKVIGDSEVALTDMGVQDGYQVFEGVHTAMASPGDSDDERANDGLDYAFLLSDTAEDGDVFFSFGPEGLQALDRDDRKLFHAETELWKMTLRDFDVPEWTHHAVWYQVFAERFRNGNPDNDPGKYDYELLVPWNSDWWAVLPGETAASAESDNFYTGTGDVWQRRYGGDFQGLQEKLPYLKSLGVNAIYLNPIFEAESMHKYDTADFRHIDDNFGVVADATTPLSGDQRELYPPSFGTETDDPSTWQWSPSDKVFLDFLAEAKRHDMRVIIDGVFNHVGRAHPFFQDVLENGQDSPYAEWFDITDWGTGGEPGEPGGIQWNAWDQPNGHLPAFAKDAELGLHHGPRQHIFDITTRWMDPNGDGDPSDGIDGWRLDVPQDIPHPFWIDWRKHVKGINPDAYITGEIWSMAQPWLKGDQFDAVMNYQFSMPTQDFFVDQATAIEPSEYAAALMNVVDAYPRPIAYAQQNLMGSHDTDRLASMFVNPDRPYDGANRPQDNAASFDPPYADRAPTDEEWARFKQLVLFQHCFVGAPMTYYGDEAGMWSPDDPSNRQPFPWPDLGPYDGESVGFNEDIFAHYQHAIAIRHRVEALRTGDVSFPVTDDDRDVLVMQRSTDEQSAYVVVNRSGEPREVAIDVAPGTYADLTQAELIETDGERPTLRVTETQDADGTLTVTLPAWGTAVLVQQP
ncbi:MAG: alpha-amylase family glycosyl hydrolase, partial [Planctomycetota bacterium]